MSVCQRVAVWRRLQLGQFPFSCNCAGKGERGHDLDCGAEQIGVEGHCPPEQRFAFGVLIAIGWGRVWPWRRASRVWCRFRSVRIWLVRQGVFGDVGQGEHIAEQAFFNVGSTEDVESAGPRGNDTECRPHEQRWVIGDRRTCGRLADR